jgi:hypothetical protein
MDGNLWLETGQPFRAVQKVLPADSLHEKEKRRSDKGENQLQLF